MTALLLIFTALALAEPFNAATRPLTERQSKLLASHQYSVRPDGLVVDRAGTPVSDSDMPFVIQRLESAERLKALLRVNIILNNSEGEKRLTPAERESIRAIAREAWPYFQLSTRKDFRRYFTPEELFALEKDPPPVLAIPGVDLKDQEPEVADAPRPVKATAAPAPEAAAPPPPPAVTPQAVVPPAPAAPPQAVVPLAPAAPPQAAVPPAPAAPPQAAVPPAPAASPQAVVPMMPAILMPARLEGGAAAEPPKPVVLIDTSSAGGFFFGGAAPAPVPSSATVIVVPEPAPLPAAPAVSTETAAAPEVSSAPAAAPVPAPEPAVVAVPPRMPPTTPVTQEALELFLVNAPYSRDAKTLLRLIREHAPERARDRALNAVMFSLPSIVQDGARAGDSWGGRLLEGSTAAPVIALRPALVVFARKRLFFGGTELVLPDAAEAYSGLGVPVPDAASETEKPFETEKGDWGEQRRYADGSLKVKLPLEAQAGALLAELLRLDARLRGEDASPEDIDEAARQARMLMYASLQQAHGHLRFLDRASSEDFRRWLDHPDEWRDELVHVMPRDNAKRDARRAPPPLRAELLEAERRFRASRAGGDDGR